MRHVYCHTAMSLSARLFVPTIVLLLISIPAYADWADWWRTPEQQAKAALASGDVETLQRVAPDATWQGIAEHESGDFESATRTFDSVARQHQVDGDIRAANRALYNQGVSEVKAGQYDAAVQTFDRVLEQEPQFDDALHNRNIAQQLIQQQEQQQQQQSGEGEGEGDSASQDGEQQPSDESGDQSSDAQNDDQAESGEQSESEQGDAGEQSGEEGGDEEPDSQSQAAADEQAAKDALEAEAQAQAANQGDDESDADAQGSAAAGQEQPMSESDQATEQWLRRIPDDPAGLLRRKLEQSHRTDYPQVRDSGEPW